MKHAASIAILDLQCDTMRTNEPINRAAGNNEQANLEAANLKDYEAAIAVLKADQQA